MWFKFPPGIESVSVQAQNFSVEAVNKETGEKFFRAPDHFSPIILDLAGFTRGDPPEGSPPDFPKAAPEIEGAVDRLSLDLAAAQTRLDQLTKENAALISERDRLKVDNEAAQAEIQRLETEASEAAKSSKTK